MECNFCKKILSGTRALNVHQTTTKSCLLIQEKEQDREHNVIKVTHPCEFCKKDFTTKANLNKHIAVCKNKYKIKHDIILQAQDKTRRIEHYFQDKFDKLYSDFNKYKEEVEDRIKKLEDSTIIKKINGPKEMSSKEIESIYQENTSLKQDYQKLLVKHNSFMKTHRYFKFKERGPCFYIIENGIPCECKHNVSRKKFGIAGLSKDNEEDTFDNRLKSHRTLWPQLKVIFVIFIKAADVLEQTIKRFYDKEINPNGHEIIQGVTTEQITERIHKWIEGMSITEYTILSDEQIQKYNDYVITTVKVNEEVIF